MIILTLFQAPLPQETKKEHGVAPNFFTNLYRAQDFRP